MVGVLLIFGWLLFFVFAVSLVRRGQEGWPWLFAMVVVTALVVGFLGY